MSIKIPTTNKRHTVSTESDLFGTLSYTKNINLDESGYIKLANRTVQIQSEKVDANMELPISFGRVTSSDTVSFHLVSSEDPFEITISPSALTVTENTASSNPNYTLDSHGRWFHNLWISTDDNGFVTLDSGGTWDVGDTSTLTTGLAHPIEVFRNKDRICFGDGNTVKMYSESSGTFTLDKTLTLPAGFEVIGLSYNNYKMGVLCQLSDTIAGQNQDAYFFTWDGSSTEAGQGIETGSDRGLGLVAYKGSWVILTRSGLLRYFTGGGWQDLVQLPFYFSDKVFGSATSRDLYGDILLVEGDVIYLNYNGLLKAEGEKYQQYLANNVGGVQVYDPKVGIYQKYSHSISPVSMLTVTQANVGTTTNIMTKTAGTIPSTGSPIKYTSDKASKIGGLKTGRIYYCIKHSSTTFSLATTKALALAGFAISLTSTGAANNYFLALEVYDYGTTLANNVGGMALVGTDNGVCNHLIFGAELQDFDSTSQYDTLELVVTGFENRGYFVTPKIMSDGITDIQKKIYIKYPPLKTNDKIIVKVKDKDILGLPVSTPQGYTSTPNQCAWTSTTVFTTIADLEDVKTAFDAGNDLECEIIAGAGAGNMVKISDITFSSPTYTVTLEEAPDGSAASRYCDVLIENWRVLGTITSADVDGYQSFLIDSKKPWVKFKIELRGVETTIEEMEIINSEHKPSK